MLLGRFESAAAHLDLMPDRLHAEMEGRNAALMDSLALSVDQHNQALELVLSKVCWPNESICPDLM